MSITRCCSNGMFCQVMWHKQCITYFNIDTMDDEEMKNAIGPLKVSSSSLTWLLTYSHGAAFLDYCPHRINCPTKTIQIGRAPWAIWAAVKNTPQATAFYMITDITVDMIADTVLYMMIDNVENIAHWHQHHHSFNMLLWYRNFTSSLSSYSAVYPNEILH